MDTLEISKELAKHGFSQEQAEAITEVFKKTDEKAITTKDLELLKSDLKSELHKQKNSPPF